QFAELDWMRNETTRYLSAKPIGAFAFIGIVERFIESLNLFDRAFGFDTPLPPPRDNINPQRSETRYSLSEADYRHILGLNAEDLAWYEGAVEKLNAFSSLPSMSCAIA